MAATPPPATMPDMHAGDADDAPTAATSGQGSGRDGARPRWRGRILPKSILGICAVMVAFSLGASLSGVVAYSYYTYRLGQTEDKVNAFIGAFGKTVKSASDSLKAEQAAASAQIQSQLQPIQRLAAEGTTLQALVVKEAPALYFVHTLDGSGQPSVGTAFAVASDSRQTLLVTSYNTVQAATKRPGPDVFVRKGNNDTKVAVYNWHPERDLALIVLPLGNQPKLDFAPQNPAIGDRVFAMSGLGAQGAAVTQGFVSDVSGSGIQHDASVAPSFQGGPLVNSDGKVLGIASRAYAPLGFSTDGVWFGVPARAACEKVLACPNNTPSGAGPQSTG
jgi:S1-C subfamily serine protease